MKSFYLTVDSLTLNADNPTDITFYLSEKLPYNFNRVGLRSLILLQPNEPIPEECYFIHCDLLNKDDNLYNGVKSDVLTFVVVTKSKKYISYKYGGILYKYLKSSDFTSIRLSLTDQVANEILLDRVVYELEFIN